MEFIEEFFTGLPITVETRKLALEAMEKYGLLPNDALIAAACRQYGIERLLSFDKGLQTCTMAACGALGGGATSRGGEGGA